jgi:acetyltransferase
VYALHEPDAFDLVGTIETFIVKDPATPLVVGVGGAGPDARKTRQALLDRGVPVAADPRGVAAMAGALLADARSRHRVQAATGAPARPLPDPGPGPGPGSGPSSGSGPGPGPWDEDQAKALLETLGVTTMPRRACADRAQAHRALGELPGPVAVKLLDAKVLHKTEIGGVRLGITTPDELDAALDALEAAGAHRFLVESMAPEGVDLVVGAHRDPVFGPAVLIGLGGTTAEALADVALRLAPLSAAEAAAMPGELAGRALLDGWRAGPVLDRAAFAEVVVAMGGMVDAWPELAEIEINPLRLTAQGLIALDAVCVAAHQEVTDGQTDQ